MNIPDKDFLEEFLIPFGSKKGCAFLGKTEFSKLKVVKNFFAEHGIVEWNGKDELDDRFVIHDCMGKAQRETIIKVVSEYRDVPYVIFDNCESILESDDVLRIFVNLIDKDEYQGTFSILNSEGSYEAFSTSSFYIFLGNENLLPKVANYPVGSDKADHISSFCTFIQCYDFNLESRYFG